ncbi:hypothetical protein [Sphingobium yanoikuyae]|uniref:hypothetical protein n=1 Tax=Sphingobium yanoikuyae TaxID=13690 RepID=UPI0035C72681
MGSIKIHAGDWGKNTSGGFAFGAFSLPKPGKFMPEGIHGSELSDVEIATEESVKRIGGTVGWGAAGAVILGPVGLLAGLLLGGRKKEVTFVAKFKDGRKFLGTTDSKTFTQMSAATFK